MRKFYFLFLILTACGSEKYFGKKIDNSEVHTYESVMNEAFTNGSIYTKISGKILEKNPELLGNFRRGLCPVGGPDFCSIF